MNYRSTWRSETEWDKINISKNMKAYLKSKIRDEQQIKVARNTLKALNNRELINIDNNLTNIGYIKGLELLSLKKQCDFLNIPLETISYPICDKPEIAALEFYKNNGYMGCFTEGGIANVILNSLCLDLFINLGRTKGIPYSHCTDIQQIKSYFYTGIGAYGYFIERVPNIEDLMLEHILNTPKWKMLENFKTLKSWQINDTWFPYHYIGLNSEIIDSIYSSLGPETLEKVAKVRFSDFYAFSKGWPDLTVYQDGKTKFVEVKVKDKLHRSQLITLPALKKYAGLNISILKIVPEAISE